MTKDSIIKAIEAKVNNSHYSVWRIGLTQDIPDRKNEWDSKKQTNLWSDWEANSLNDAQDIESYFINKGMQGGTGGILSPTKTTFVYVF